MDLRAQLQTSLATAYTIERELGAGGMSRVYVAWERSLERRVVVKVLPPELVGEVSLERFRREIAVVARLQHAHIVPVLAAGIADGVPYYTMPFVEGETLRARLSGQGELALPAAIKLLRDVASALACAHERGIVHRDIKPENVLLTSHDALVTDFGIAKAIALSQASPEADATLTEVGLALGTPAYMSPEQASADPHVDQRADVYAFGCVAYEVLSGRAPFAGRTPQAMLAAHVTEAPEPLARLRPAVPAPLAALVMRCLEKRPADRPQSGSELLAQLEALTTPGLTASAAEPRPRRRARVVIATAAVLVLAAAGAFARKSLGADRGLPPANSVAVLPLESIGADRGDAYFAEGMTEEITDALSRVPGLRVPTRMAAAAMARRETDPRRVAERLGVRALLQGSVQRAGDRVRISVHLVNAADGFQVWADRYDGAVKDVFAVQDSIARAIVAGLRVGLAAAPGHPLVRAATADPVAHDLYLQGLYLWNRRTSATLQRAISYFRNAVDRDPRFATAWAALAIAYGTSVDYSPVNVRQTTAAAFDAAARALALDSTLAPAWAAIGVADERLYRNADAEAAYRHAIALDSSYAAVHAFYAMLLDDQGRFDAALGEMRTAQHLDPASLIINTNIGYVLFHARRYAEAESALRAAIALDPTFANAHRHLGNVLIERGRIDEGVRELRRSVELTGGRVNLSEMTAEACLDARLGRTGEARAILDTIVAMDDSGARAANYVALVDDALGDRDHALAELRRAVEHFAFSTGSHDPKYDGLRADPRAAELFARVEAR